MKRHRRTTPRRWHAVVVGAVVAATIVACGKPVAGEDDAAPPRRGRFGSLRDFVLLERPRLSASQAVFVDRFEATRSDWADFVASPAGRRFGASSALLSGDGALPVAHVDLRQARAFAHWRFARLPRADEWWFACLGDRPSLFPWGFKEDPTRANTSDLGLGEATRVGTFESGRRAGADAPYDLIGNVSEWSETIPPDWYGVEFDPIASLSRCRARVLATPALSCWQAPGGILPLVLAASAGGDSVPREVLGSDFQTPMEHQVEAVLAGDRRRRTGLRLFTTAEELLVSLTAVEAADSPVAAGPEDLEQLARFVRRGRHRAVLRECWLALRSDPRRTNGPIGARLEQLLMGEGLDGR